MLVRQVVEKDEGQWTARAFIHYGIRHVHNPTEVWFRSTEPFSRTGDYLVPLCLMPAMQRMEDLVLADVDVSTRLEGNLDQIQTLYESFAPDFGHRLSRIQVIASGGTRLREHSGTQVGCFFSGGVDSFYSVLKHQDELDALIHIQGFDWRLDQPAVLEEETKDVREAASALGIRLVEVATSVRADFSDAWLHWELYHGGVMAAIAHLLSSTFRRIYIASSYPYFWQDACGTHPLLDPLWAPEGMELVHDGGERNRWAKLTEISTNEVVQKHLRVCWHSANSLGNCGQCRNCVRAMAVLRVLGRERLFEVFPQTLDVSRLSETGVGGMKEVLAAIETLKYLEPDEELSAALRKGIKASLAKVSAKLKLE
jgi:hypothetical protein